MIERRLRLVAFKRAHEVGHQFIQRSILLIAVERIGSGLICPSLDAGGQPVKLVLQPIIGRRREPVSQSQAFFGKRAQNTGDNRSGLLEAKGDKSVPLRAASVKIGFLVDLYAEFIFEELRECAIKDISERLRSTNPTSHDQRRS